MILGRNRTCAPVACAGLLVIGDPHVSSRRPGRRKDPDWPAAILAKLEACVAIANARDLLPVLLGDLFDRPVEPDVALVSRLVRLLRGFRHRPLANVGNHDVAHARLSDGDSLALLALADVLDVAAEAGPVAEAIVAGRRLRLGMTPWGEDLPRAVDGEGADAVVWFTHHDVAFAGAAYPGAVPPHAVAGCALVVNGHVHRRHAPQRAGETVWANPGAITRGSVDLIDHVPAAWILAGDLSLTPESLPHAADVFDLTGRLVPAAASAGEPVESAFVSLLGAESATDMARSDDGSLLAEEAEAKFAREDTPEPVRAAVRSLLAEAVARRR